VGNLGGVETTDRAWHDQPQSAELTLPPLGVLWLRPERADGPLVARSNRRVRVPGPG
jgi:1,4-alpha-glucan branching enzyme